MENSLEVPQKKRKKKLEQANDTATPFLVKVKVKGAQSGLTLYDPWTTQSMEFSRPEYWSG